MQAELLQIAANAVTAKLIGASRDTKLLVSQMLSYEVEGAERNEQFRAGNWDGRSSFFDFRSETFPAGFVHMVGRELTKLGHRVQYAIKRPPAQLGPEVGTFDPLGYGFTDDYDYQPEAVRRAVRYGRMIAQIATGGGKSNVAALYVSTLRRPTLFLTTRSSLMHQMKETFEQAGFIPGVMGDGVWQPRKGVNVGMVQTLAARLALPSAEDRPEKADAKKRRRDLTLALLSYFEAVIGEEAHEVGGTDYYEVMSQCRNAHYRLALTATPFMRPDGEANMRLQAAFGSIGIQVSEKLLIDRGILATPKFKIVASASPRMLRRSTRWPTCYDIGIVENIERNRAVVFEGVRAVKYGLTVMVQVQREKHGATLQKMFAEAGVRSLFVFGKDEQETRKTALNDLKAQRIDVLISTTIFDVGVDVPSVGMVILAGAGKAEVGTRQRIGRGLRRKKHGPNTCFIVDFEDRYNRYLQEHALTRRVIIETTPGFSENLLAPGEDFPYAQYIDHPNVGRAA